VSIESDAQNDLSLSDEDAEGVVGGHKAAHKSHKSENRTEPLMIKQTTTFGGTTESANSGDDDCAPENAGD
jgi:hypothetical protein